jgi:hypothetical protein
MAWIVRPRIRASSLDRKESRPLFFISGGNLRKLQATTAMVLLSGNYAVPVRIENHPTRTGQGERRMS